MPNYRRLFIPNSYLFLTIVTNNRRPILLQNIDVLRAAFKHTKNNYNFEILACVILPDHIHLLLKPENIKDYPKIVRAIKYNFSKKFNNGVSEISPLSKKATAGRIAIPPYAKKQIWQRRYWEHTIRDDEDLYKHLDYIHYNPVKHVLVKNVKDWEFSSFSKFVEMKNYDLDWGSSKDVKHIATMDYD